MFLNSNGHGQALQFIMQGYSDSIKAKSSNQGTAMANAFNQGLSNAVQTHDNHEQALQNREATRLQNEYMNKTMEDRVRHQAQQTEANDLANDYTRRTLDDRVRHQAQQTKANELNNNYQAIKNEIADKTKGTEIDKINWANKQSVAESKLSTQKNGILLENYIGSQPVRQVGNKYQQLVTRKDSAGKTYQEWQDIDKATYYRQKEINSNTNDNRRTYGETDTTANKMIVAQQQAQRANAEVNKGMWDANYKAINETKQLLADTDVNEVAFLINQAAKQGQSYITVGGNNIDLLLAKEASGYGLGGPNGGHIGGGININHADKSTIRERDINAAYNLYHHKDDPQARDRIAMQQKYKKEYGEISKSLESISHFSQIMQDLGDKNRASLAIGSLSRFIGGGEDYAKFQAQNSIALASMAKQTFGGQISDRDMQIMTYQTAKMWESTPATMARLEQTLANQISKLQGKIKGIPVGINIMTPEQQEQYIGLTKLYQAIMQGKKK